MTGSDMPPAHFAPVTGATKARRSEKAREEKAGENDHCVLRSH